MESERTGSDLEDGEIREDDFEDISDGSLSDVIPEDCSDDCNLDSLRQEALKSLPVNENETNEEEKYRLEALKSLLENTDFLNENEDSLQDVDDLTEEEKYRLEAIKSLLRNTDFLENLSQSEPPQPQPSNTKKRKRRKRNKNNSIKRIKSETSVETYERTTQAYLEETTSLLSGLSEDVKKINKSLEDKKNNYTDSTNGDKENDTYDSSKLNEIKPPVMDSLTSTPRPWYPKTEFTLLDISSAQNIEIKNNSGDGDYKVLRKQVKCAFSQKNRKLVTTKTTIKRQVSPKSSKPYDSRTVAKSKKLPKVDSASHHLTHIVQTTQVQSVQVETLLNTSAIESPLPSSKDVDANTPIETPAPLPNGLVNNEAINSSFKISTPLREFPTRSFVPSNKIVKSLPKVINANLRYRTVLPTHNNNFSFVPNKDRYKINNTLNTSKYVLKKPTFKVNNSKMKLDKTRKSRYSINHGNNKYKKVNSINPKEFIISLNDEDSSKEDDIKDQTISNKIPRYQNEISSFTIKPPAADETPLHATKSIPQNEVQLSTVKSLPNDDLPITPIKSISNDITLSAIKIAPRDDIPASPKPLVVDEIPFKIKEEPMDIPEESNEDTMSSELPSTTTLEITACVKEETFVGVIDTEPSPISENDEGCETGSIQNEEVTSVKHETNEITPPPSQPELPAEKDETELLYEAEENLIEIRSKLLSSLDELDATVKQNSEEKQKLINMIKQLKLLKAAVTKVEDRIKTQKMKLVMSNSFVRSLCEGVSLRSKTCSKLKDLCAMAGKKIIGPQYKPPDTFETQIAEKEKTVDFSKYILRKPKPTDKK